MRRNSEVLITLPTYYNWILFVSIDHQIISNVLNFVVERNPSVFDI
jgi:hypothetical protein